MNSTNSKNECLGYNVRWSGVLWLLISATSGFAGFMAAYTIDKSLGWPSILVAIGIWLAVGLILQRQEFKGAPKHIQFIDP